MAAVQNASFASPLADSVRYVNGADNSFIDGVVSTISGLSGWTVLFTILLSLVAYDQSAFT